MAVPLSPAVVVNEYDLTTVIPAVSLTPGCIAGVFAWGPLQTLMTVQTISQLENIYGQPSNLNGETWFSAANFLSYGGNLIVARAADTSGQNVESFFAATNTSPIFVGNTSNVTVGMVLFSSNNYGTINPTSNGAVTVASVNATAIVLSTPATNTAANVDMIFRENKVFSAVAQETPNAQIPWSAQIVQNPTNYFINDGTYDPSVQWIAKYPGAYGNDLRISICDSPNTYSSNVAIVSNATLINATASFMVGNVGSNVISFTVTPANTANATHVTGANVQAGALQASISIGDLILCGNVTIGQQILKVSNVGVVGMAGNVYSFNVNTTSPLTIVSNTTNTYLQKYWEFAQIIGTPPGQSLWQRSFGNSAANDELHVVIVDQNGVFTGIPGAILEKYQGLSRAIDAQVEGGQTNYFKTIINNQSQFIWHANDRISALSNTSPFLTSSTATHNYDVQMYGGWDGLDEAHIPIGKLTAAYDQFNDPVNVNIGLIITGKARGIALNNYMQLAQYLIQNIAEIRKDCVVFCSPDYSHVVNQKGYEASNIINAVQTSLPSSSYGFMDSGYKYQYDTYNNVYRWIPLNGDIAGLATRTDATNNPWWSFAGYNRGGIKNVTKLAYNPIMSDRNLLYAACINPVCTFPGQGTVLFGDKTLLNKPSAFNRINVRRLFITLEVAIATAAKFTLFEFNDDFTQSAFRAMVKPFLTQVKAQRGLRQFLVICDGTNNTPQVVVNNQFVADIYIMPNYSINWVILNFVAVPPTMSFTEAVGQFGASA